jgi:hypothetical protein
MYVVRGGANHLEEKFAEVSFGSGTINPELDPTWSKSPGSNLQDPDPQHCFGFIISDD